MRTSVKTIASAPALQPAAGLVPDGHDLSPRQAQVAVLLSEGLTHKAIAAELQLNEETVAHHLRVALRKLHIHSRAELTARRVREPSGHAGEPPYTNV